MADIFLRLLVLLTKWKPDWLYEVMPFVYLFAGLAVMYQFNSLAGYGAGALLLIAAFLIWIMRIEYRTRKSNHADNSRFSNR